MVQVLEEDSTSDDAREKSDRKVSYSYSTERRRRGTSCLWLQGEKEAGFQRAQNLVLLEDT